MAGDVDEEDIAGTFPAETLIGAGEMMQLAPGGPERPAAPAAPAPLPAVHVVA
jgi:hypothetical protein